jgi:hypothetical protein
LVFLCRSFCVEQRLQLQVVKVSIQFQITKHLKLVVLLQRAKFLCGYLQFEALKVDLAPQHVGDLLIPLMRWFQINKHLNLGIWFENVGYNIVLNNRGHKLLITIKCIHA